MQERFVLVNHLSTGSIARRLLFHMGGGGVTPLYAPVSKHDLLEEPGAGACHIIFREFRYLGMHILLEMIR